MSAASGDWVINSFAKLFCVGMILVFVWQFARTEALHKRFNMPESLKMLYAVQKEHKQVGK